MNDNDYLKLQWHLDMMKAARERWPEMVEEPRIVGASPGVSGLDMCYYAGGGGLLRTEHIQLERVGPYRLGYGPLSKTLYVGSEHHVTFTTEEHINLTPGNEAMRQRAAEARAAGKSPFIEL